MLWSGGGKGKTNRIILRAFLWENSVPTCAPWRNGIARQIIATDMCEVASVCGVWQQIFHVFRFGWWCDGFVYVVCARRTRSVRVPQRVRFQFIGYDGGFFLCALVAWRKGNAIASRNVDDDDNDAKPKPHQALGLLIFRPARTSFGTVASQSHRSRIETPPPLRSAALWCSKM